MYGGVLPYAVHKGVVYFLLGKEATHPGFADSRKWSDFGGNVDDEDKDTRRAAAREAFEESMGVLGNAAQIYKALKHEHSFSVIGPGRCYLMQIPYDGNVVQNFHAVYQYGHWLTEDFAVREGGLEKTHVMWISHCKLEALAKDARVVPDVKLRPLFARMMTERMFKAFSFRKGKMNIL